MGVTTAVCAGATDDDQRGSNHGAHGEVKECARAREGCNWTHENAVAPVHSDGNGVAGVSSSA